VLSHRREFGWQRQNILFIFILFLKIIFKLFFSAAVVTAEFGDSS